MKKIFFAFLPVFVISGFNIFIYGQSNANHATDSAVKIDTRHFHNLWKVSDSLYRSEQPTEGDYVYLQHKLAVKSILNLCPVPDDTAQMAKCKLIEYNVPMKAESINDNQIINALKDMMNAPKPLLVHCYQGSDRTGVVIAMYRIIFDNWTKEQAIKEMEDGGFGFHKGNTNIIHYIEKADIEKMKKKLTK